MLIISHQTAPEDSYIHTIVEMAPCSSWQSSVPLGAAGGLQSLQGARGEPQGCQRLPLCKGVLILCQEPSLAAQQDGRGDTQPVCS